MVFKDIKVNLSDSSNERYTFLKEQLDTLSEGRKVCFIGETFYTMDLDLDQIHQFTTFLSEYQHLKFYIQDLEKVTSGIESDQNEVSWYELVIWPANVRVFVRFEDIKLTQQHIKGAKSFKEEIEQLETDTKINVQYDIDEVYSKHQDDLIGLFIEDIRSQNFSEAMEQEIIDIGLDYLLGR